ncbi:MAG TPA: GDSL-type esterase/lipase family protein [Xanthobacteraceae bacterium]|nr:GDSL-type esterase/lipase family protein [Xanthobacteraceae bacterium]
MRAAGALLTAILIGLGSARAGPSNGCGAPGYFMHGDSLLERVNDVVAKTNTLKIVVFGTASSTLGGSNGSRDAYPARLEAALREMLPEVVVNVAVYARPRQLAEKMMQSFDKVLEEEKPSLVIWQTGTFDAIQGVDPREFLARLTEGVEKLKAAGVDVVLVNMQYNPRTEGIVAIEAYAENMRWVARERQVPLFDRLAIMRYWNEAGIINLHTASRDFVVAKRVHDCIGRALAALVIDAARLTGIGKKALQ